MIFKGCVPRPESHRTVTSLHLAKCLVLSSPFCPLNNDGSILSGDDVDRGWMKWLIPKLQLLCLVTLWAGSSWEWEHIPSPHLESFLQFDCKLTLELEGCDAVDSNDKNDVLAIGNSNATPRRGSAAEHRNQERKVVEKLRRTFTRVTSNRTATIAKMALSSQISQFSMLSPISSISRMKSELCENSSHKVARTGPTKAA